jgi:hypothetical protein
MQIPLETIEAKSNLRDGYYALRALQLGRALFHELHLCTSVGLEAPLAEGALPCLTALARSATHITPLSGDVSISDVEQVLDWAIAHMDSPRHRQGASDLLGMHDSRGLDEPQRYNRAASNFGHDSGERLIEGTKDVWVITFVRDHLVRLAGHMELWPVKEPPGTFF